MGPALRAERTASQELDWVTRGGASRAFCPLTLCWKQTQHSSWLGWWFWGVVSASPFLPPLYFCPCSSFLCWGPASLLCCLSQGLVLGAAEHPLWSSCWIVRCALIPDTVPSLVWWPCSSSSSHSCVPPPAKSLEMNFDGRHVNIILVAPLWSAVGWEPATTTAKASPRPCARLGCWQVSTLVLRPPPPI